MSDINNINMIKKMQEVTQIEKQMDRLSLKSGEEEARRLATSSKGSNVSPEDGENLEDDGLASASAADDELDDEEASLRASEEAKKEEGAVVEYIGWSEPNEYQLELEREETFWDKEVQFSDLVFTGCSPSPSGCGNIGITEGYLSQVVLSRADIPVIDVRFYAKMGGPLVPVTVPEVSTPHRFIIHLNKFRLELAKLMARMLTFYTLNHENYGIGNYQFLQNEVCAVVVRSNPVCEEWYRAYIIRFGCDSSRVYLFDYGLTMEVWNRDIKFLERSFGELPPQAIRGHLPNLRPRGSEFWSEETCKRFFSYVFEKDLMAEVIDMNFKTCRLSVILWYANENFCINNALIEEDYPNSECDVFEPGPDETDIFESINPGRFVQPKDIGKHQKLRSDLWTSGEYEKHLKEETHEKKAKELGRLLGLEERGDGTSSDSESN